MSTVSFEVVNAQQAALLAELLEKAAVTGGNARALADLYDEAQRVKAAFADGT